MAASVANLIDLILLTMGYRMPAFRLFLGFPFIKSRPQYFNSSFFSSVSPGYCDAAWRTLSLETSSVASLAAFVAKVLGMTFKASLNSATAVCSFPSTLKFSKWMFRATSHAPPPGTTQPDSRVLLQTQIESWMDLNYCSFTFPLRRSYIHWLL